MNEFVPIVDKFSAFDPFLHLRIACEEITKDEEYASLRGPIGLAQEYFRQWEIQGTRGVTRYNSISRPPLDVERSDTALGAQSLVEELTRLGVTEDDHVIFNSLFQAHIARLVDATRFADTEAHQQAANTIVWTATRLLMLFKKRGEAEKVQTTVLAVLFIMQRFGEWLSERT
jgi:hypothetical protein